MMIMKGDRVRFAARMIAVLGGGGLLFALLFAVWPDWNAPGAGAEQSRDQTRSPSNELRDGRSPEKAVGEVTAKIDDRGLPEELSPTDPVPSADRTASLEAGLSLDTSFLSRIQTIANTAADFSVRNEAAQGLSGELHRDEIRALYRFLLAPPPVDDQNKRQDRALKNAVMNRLRKQTETPGGLTKVMTAMFADEKQDPGVRDYALQQMRAWYWDAPPEERPDILDAIVGGLGENDSGIGGTVLLALAELAGELAEDEGIDIGIAAWEMAESPASSDLTRVTALQVLVARLPARAVELAEAWAFEPGAGYPRRIAAIAALGAAATDEAAVVLSRLQSLGDDVYLAPAFQAAHRKITSKMNMETRRP